MRILIIKNHEGQSLLVTARDESREIGKILLSREMVISRTFSLSRKKPFFVTIFPVCCLDCLSIQVKYDLLPDRQLSWQRQVSQTFEEYIATKYQMNLHDDNLNALSVLKAHYLNEIITKCNFISHLDIFSRQ